MAGRKHLDFGAPSPTFSPHTASAPEPGLQQLGGSPLSRDAIRLGPAEVGSSEVAADATALGERAVPDHTAAPDVALRPVRTARHRSEEHTSELQSRGHLVCRLLLEKKKRTRAGVRGEIA